MSKRVRIRLLSLLLLLGATAGVLGSQGGPAAEAGPCCEFCYPIYEACTAHPATCDWQYENCLATCSYC
jgi:hypothetical protein